MGPRPCCDSIRLAKRVGMFGLGSTANFDGLHIITIFRLENARWYTLYADYTVNMSNKRIKLGLHDICVD